ncbi:anhydro-N-acetylmuramic acid kinase [Fulvivirgaceae bacterium PWU4]|uniref:Anhydro-N-acetylmuramic acid kinase n=1 Tax=Chryseosolibacter histidini TaxID=2782349 RepID=A0AAP2GKC9_9BACT|nr:anhydro-N-acetylmuramic acid kinase [Chryseosolibacter histidini]MBT1698919.1 anhydro-N-acetylmuramic acid kinase [Chryseosolibacter histidini]
MKMANKYKVIGLMSGTSLDGLDVACCTFRKKSSGWDYTIDKAITVKYPAAWYSKLSQAHLLSGEALMALDAEYGKYLGNVCSKFISLNKLNVDFISSHGHTIFHQPARGFTYQLGNGNTIHAVTGLPVISDFRSLDVALGGEGAPLVPAGDKFLFEEYDVCLNLGGIANLSMDVKGARHAFDICFCNMGLNYLATKAGKEIDTDGDMAASGEVDSALLNRLKKIYASLREKRPSLGREMFEKQIKPLLDNEDIDLNDRLATFTESIAFEIIQALPSRKNASVLCTGGGAFNAFLIARMLHYAGDDAALIVPEENVIKFKEALVFAFLGVLRAEGDINCLKSVTHASRDSSSGVMTGF